MTLTYHWRGDFENAALAGFEDHLASFYFQACGFTPTAAGLIALSGRRLAGAGQGGT